MLLVPTEKEICGAVLVFDASTLPLVKSHGCVDSVMNLGEVADPNSTPLMPPVLPSTVSEPVVNWITATSLMLKPPALAV